MKEKPVISIVVPIYNEQESLPVLYERMVGVMDSTGEPWEGLDAAQLAELERVFGS